MKIMVIEKEDGEIVWEMMMLVVVALNYGAVVW